MHLRSIFTTLSVLILLLAVGAGIRFAADVPSAGAPDHQNLSPAVALAQAPTDDPAALITPEAIYNRIYFLASDALKGRDTPSPGLEAAASYLVSEHRRMGLEPGADGSYYQRWPYRLVGTDVEEATVALRGSDGQEHQLLPGRDVALRGATDGAVDAPLTHVRDWEGAPTEGALDGQVAVIPLDMSEGWSQQARIQSLRQARFAEASGAVATIHLLGADVTAGELEALAQELASPGRVMGYDLPHPQIFLSRRAATDAIQGLGQVADGASGSSATTSLDARLVGELPLRIHDDAHPSNVVAVIPGSDPELREEYVVLSAHYDHVGVGTPVDGDSIYNGADDNASGTAVLLETARAISSMSEAPRRSVAFVHVSGEEKGLLGAEWFVENPPMPVERMVANINADMVGGDTHTDTLVVIGKEYSSLGPLVDRINDSMPELGLVTSDDLWPEQRFFYRSDQFHFMRKEIPSLFFFTGVHECYHRPCDTADFIDPDKASRIARLLVHSVLEIANTRERPEWDPAGLAEVRQLTGAGR